MSHDWKSISIPSTATMREVLALIDKTAMQIALVVDDGCHLMGVITDGDIRRALLKGETLDAPVNCFMNTNAITGLIDEDPESWQRSMQRHTLQHLPLLSADGCIIDIARREIPEEPKRDNTVVIMAGGMGTRLRPLTYSHPKPLLKIGDKPILGTIIENFITQGFYDFKICINYHGDKIRNYCGNGSRWGVDIDYIQEDKRLGTAGALSLLPQKPERPFFVMNGDLLTKVDFVRLLGFHLKQGNQATMCIREYRYQVPYGVVELKNHQINHLQEKPVYFHNVNAGIYLLEPSVLDNLPENQYFDMTSLFETMIKNKTQVGSFPLTEYWMDIGRMEDYEQADLEYSEQFG